MRTQAMFKDLLKTSCFQLFQILTKKNINMLRFKGYLILTFFTKGICIWQPEYGTNVINI